MLGLGQRGVPRSVAAIVAAASSPIGWHVLNGAATFTLTGFGYPQARVVGIIEQLGAGYPRIGRAARPGIGAGYPGICPALQTPAAARWRRGRETWASQPLTMVATGRLAQVVLVTGVVLSMINSDRLAREGRRTSAQR